MEKKELQKSYLSKENVCKVYKAGAKKYNNIMDIGWRTLINREKVVNLIDQKANDKVMEIGVGTGLNFKFYKYQKNVIGIDITLEMLEVAKHDYRHLASNFILMDGEDLQFEDDYFNALVITLVISATPNPILLLKEALRVTKPSGKLAVLDVCQSPDVEISNVQESLIMPYSTTTGFPAPNKDLPGGVIVYQPNRNIEGLVKETGWNVKYTEYHDVLNPFTCRLYLYATK